MTRDDTLRTALDLGAEMYSTDRIEFWMPAFWKFVEKVRASEREKVAAWMIDLSYATGHGDTIEDLLEALAEQVEERVTNAIRARGQQ